MSKGSWRRPENTPQFRGNYDRIFSKPEPRMMYCDDCDGCGWHEGGSSLATTCTRCSGTGIVEQQ